MIELAWWQMVGLIVTGAFFGYLAGVLVTLRYRVRR
jgi:hypothetical protein